MREAFVLLLGLATGILVGLMGIGGGTVVVPAMVYLLGMDQHVAQGTSLLMQLLPLGLGAMWVYWKKGAVDLWAGIVCALGFLPGGYIGGRVALAISSHNLESLFGLFLVFSAAMLVFEPGAKRAAARAAAGATDGSSGAAKRDSLASKAPRLTAFARDDNPGRIVGVFAMSVFVGIASGLFGIGGGVLIVPLLVLLFGFEQHRAQGTSLIALVPPTGLFACLTYYHAHQVDVKVAALLTPGFVLGGVLGGRLATRLASRTMRLVFAVFLLLVGAFAAASGWMR
ncbi:MAG TPA: sulfite exporter TauE/SafE family protein [Candidatus Acidoferrales bacterium]|nr:sulfite exporter TauE/SafE family protein [Candidatus Acidoferrales bacterium]